MKDKASPNGMPRQIWLVAWYVDDDGSMNNQS
jgi:hypothetical protein